MRQQMEEGCKAFGHLASRSAERVYPARFLCSQIIPTTSVVHDEQQAFVKRASARGPFGAKAKGCS
jgi:hypothetical protein